MSGAPQITLPLHVQEALGIGTVISEAELSIQDVACQFAREVFGLSGNEFAAAAAKTTSSTTTFDVVLVGRVPCSWKYMEILVDDVLECTAVCVPEKGQEAPPTSASQMLVEAWFYDREVLDANNDLRRAIVRRISKIPKASEFAIRFISEWAIVCPLLDGSPVPPTWTTKNQLQFRTSSKIWIEHGSDFRFGDLFIEAVSEVKTKWRYLSVYRIFEHGLLLEIFESMRSTFFSAPKDSLSTATEALNSELNQLFALVMQVNLEAQFSAIHDAFKAAVNSGNSLAVALDRSFEQSWRQDKDGGSWRKGVWVFYRLRCAIVHAGMSSLIFDAYSDGAALLESVLPICEDASLQFLGVRAL